MPVSLCAEAALEITEAEGFDDIREKIDAQRGIGVALMYVGEYAEALPYLDEATALATRIRATDQIANALGIKAQCLFRMDRWDAVLETEKQWRELEGSYSRERIGETCFFVALSARVHALHPAAWSWCACTLRSWEPPRLRATE